MEGHVDLDLDDAARAILGAALAEARALGQPRCGTEHLLLGAASLPELDEHKTLTLFGLAYPVVEVLVEHMGAATRVRGPLPEPLPLSERATAALSARRADGAGPTGWSELLYGALRDEQSGASDVVRRLGKDLAWFRTALEQQTRHLTHEQAQAEAVRLNAASRAPRPPWIGPDPEALCIEVALPDPRDRHGAVELARHGGTTLRIASLFAGGDGFGFTVLLDGTAWDRPPHFEHYDPASGAAQDEQDVLRIGARFADGSTADNSHRHSYGYDIDQPPVGRVLAVGGEGISTSGRRASARADLWSWPLPPPGPITIDIAWPAQTIAGTLHLSGDLILAAARSTTAPESAGFEIVASWLPPDFVLQRSGPGGATMHVVTFSVDGIAPEPPSPPPVVVYSATWTGRPEVLGEGRLDFPRITLTAIRGTNPAVPPGGTTEHLGDRTVTLHPGDPTHLARWDEDGLQVQVFGHAITIEQFRTFLAGLRRPT